MDVPETRYTETVDGVAIASIRLAEEKLPIAQFRPPDQFGYQSRMQVGFADR